MSRPKRSVAEHGTHVRYTQGCRCRPCKDAHADYARELRAERAERGRVPAYTVRRRITSLSRHLSLLEISIRADLSYWQVWRIATGRTKWSYTATRDAIFGVTTRERVA